MEDKELERSRIQIETARKLRASGKELNQSFLSLFKAITTLVSHIYNYFALVSCIYTPHFMVLTCMWMLF